MMLWIVFTSNPRVSTRSSQKRFYYVNISNISKLRENESMRKMDSILTRMSFSKIARRAFSLLVVLTMAVNTFAVPVSAVFEGMPICGAQEHTHSDACYTASSTVVCGSEESAEHTHSEGCFLSESVLTCQIPEHTHTAVCYLQQTAGNAAGGGGIES